MNYDNKWKIGENFVVIKEEDELPENLSEAEFNNLIKSLKNVKDVDNSAVKNSATLLRDYRDVLNYISQKCKVGALTEIENLVNKKLKK